MNTRVEILMISVTKFIAHLVNHQVLPDVVAFELLHLLLHNPKDDSVEVAKEFMMQAGNMLMESNPKYVQCNEVSRFHFEFVAFFSCIFSPSVDFFPSSVIPY